MQRKKTVVKDRCRPLARKFVNGWTSLGQMSVKYIHVFIKQRPGNDHTHKTVRNPQIDLMPFLRDLGLQVTECKSSRGREKQMKEKPNPSPRYNIIYTVECFLFSISSLSLGFISFLPFFFYFSDTVIPLGRPVFRWIKCINIHTNEYKENFWSVNAIVITFPRLTETCYEHYHTKHRLSPYVFTTAFRDTQYNIRVYSAENV